MSTKLTIFICSAGDMEPRCGWPDQERERAEHERALDLARERELHPPTETEPSDVVPAEALADWDAYQ